MAPPDIVAAAVAGMPLKFSMCKIALGSGLDVLIPTLPLWAKATVVDSILRMLKNFICSVFIRKNLN
jgi:hypothetical protein